MGNRKQFCLKGLQEAYQVGFREIIEQYGGEISENGILLLLEHSRDGSVTAEKKGNALILRGRDASQFYLGLAAALAEKEWKKEGQVFFSCRTELTERGVMVDCSRNSVPKLSALRAFVRQCACLGLNQLFLYMEDVYELPGYPYFGAFRGRYALSDLKELDAYGAAFGVEVIPCIQTLAHLHTFLRWREMQKLQDTPDILLAGSAETKAFVRAVIHTMSDTFRTRKIHLGMDEAHDLGLGVYLKKHGYRSRFEILNRHLEMVSEICTEAGLKPMIWSDMYFRLASPTGDYYDLPEELSFPEEVQVPEAVSLVYWDYYHNTSAYYEQYFRMHEKLLQEGGAERLYLACGGWTFHGLAPGYTKMRETVRAGVAACRHGQVSKVFCTFWQDNGAETPLMTALYGMTVFSCACYGQEEKMVSSWCRFFTGFSEGAWMLLDRFDTMPGTVPGNVNTDNPSKYLFYQDVLLGLFDRQVETLDLTHYYGKLKQELQEALKEKKEPDAWQLLFRYYGLLAEILEKKSELGIRLKRAYDAGDTRALEVMKGDLKTCIRLVKDFRELREEIWFTESRAFGFEVLDIRLGGLIQRLKSARKRLKAYLVGTVPALEELEEPRLPFESSLQDTEHVLCACNLWEQIVTAGNLTGV